MYVACFTHVARGVEDAEVLFSTKKRFLSCNRCWVGLKAVQTFGTKASIMHACAFLHILTPRDLLCEEVIMLQLAMDDCISCSWPLFQGGSTVNAIQNFHRGSGGEVGCESGPVCRPCLPRGPERHILLCFRHQSTSTTVSMCKCTYSVQEVKDVHVVYVIVYSNCANFLRNDISQF